jgi:2,3-bisphosphoglycerate-dependent phosphoglycerate mutase
MFISFARILDPPDRPLMTLVLVRHGQSVANVNGYFSGWMNPDMTEQGRKEAVDGALLLRSHSFRFDIAFTSSLKRAIRSLWIALEVIDQCFCPYECHWRLNERHFGGLTGIPIVELTKRMPIEMQLFGESFEFKPPLVPQNSELDPAMNPKYAGIDRGILPRGESLAEMWERAKPVWTDRIYPALRARKTVLLVGHGDFIRAVMKHIEGLTGDEIMQRPVPPNGRPFRYCFDEGMHIVRAGLLQE